MSPPDCNYVSDRLESQINYLSKAARKNKTNYQRLKTIAIICNVLTTMIIALAFTVPEEYKVLMGIIALVLSTLVLATYQWEEFYNYGGKWQKFRLISERLKSEKYNYLVGTGPYAMNDPDEKMKMLVFNVENIMRSTDEDYFAYIVGPGQVPEAPTIKVGKP